MESRIFWFSSSCIYWFALSLRTILIVDRVCLALFASRFDQWQEFEMLWWFTFCISFVMRKNCLHIWSVRKIQAILLMYDVQSIDPPIHGSFDGKSFFILQEQIVRKCFPPSAEDDQWWKRSFFRLLYQYNDRAPANQQFIWIFEIVPFCRVRQEQCCENAVWSILSLSWRLIVVTNGQRRDPDPDSNTVYFLMWIVEMIGPVTKSQFTRWIEEGGYFPLQWSDYHWQVSNVNA